MEKIGWMFEKPKLEYMGQGILSIPLVVQTKKFKTFNPKAPKPKYKVKITLEVL